MPRRQLGRHLRQLREEAGITVKAAAESLEWSGPKLWRIEKGLTSMRVVDVRAMCEFYGADERTTEALASLAKATKDPGWWHAYGDTVPAWFELYVGLEEAASGLRIYQPELVPGLLQTPGYARAIIRVVNPKLSEEEIEERLQPRLHRQKLLGRRAPAPPRLDVIVSETALLRMPEDQADARDQLLHLVEMATQPRISISVLPLTRRLHKASHTGPFTILDFPRKGAKLTEPTTVYCEGLTGALYLDQEHEIAQYEEMWASIADDSLSGEDAINLIRTRAEELS